MMKLELIENAGAAWRFWSVRLSAGIVAVAAAEPYLPTLKAVLPPAWYGYAAGAVMVARLFKQR
ncbi:hypothetical protein [Vogesella mureinivorans]|jgi:hypothetical protein|uniref:DUF7940 domain-containing protein n=2 Tax=Vogesella mureinivorans TaxID=657276 RepID=UPI0011C9AEB0|nr:hypothetical protein [Vogesella mureinivorans]